MIALLKSDHKRLKNVATLALGLIVGIGILMIVKSGKSPVAVAEAAQFSTPVTYAEIQPVKFKSSLTGFGVIEPTIELNISSEVTGKVSWIHPDLKSGKLITEGTVVLKLDDEDLELALKQTQSELAVRKAQLLQKKMELSVSENTLVSAKERLKLAKNELKRQTSLVAEGLLSSSNLDKQKQQVLNQEAEVANLELSLAIMPSSIGILEAELASSQARLEQRQRDANRSSISLNRTGRIGDVLVTEGTFVMTGSKLFELSSIDKFDVNVQVPANQFYAVFNSVEPESLRAMITVNHNGIDQQIEGEVRGLDEGLDAQTRMLGVVVSINDKEKMLVKGAYAKVLLQKDEETHWVLPRSAVHQDQLYWVDSQDQLQIVDAKIAFYQGDYAVLSEPPLYKKLVTSTLFPAINGMVLDLYRDETFETRLSGGLSIATYN